MTPLAYVAAYFCACVGGWFVVACCMCVMHRLVLKEWRPFSEWSDFLVGAIERAVALTLVLLAPSYLPTFIGAWIALKMALGWQRDHYSDSVRLKSLLGLIGSVISFAIAIVVGYALNPDALDVWATAH